MQGKRIIVTGAFGALGQTLARLLKEQGAALALIDQSQPNRDAAGFALGGVDLSDNDAAEAAVAKATDKLGGLDGLANIAGAFRWETVEAGAVATWDFLYKVNLKTALCTSRAALPMLSSKGGAIVNVGAAAALKSASGMGAYAASKSAVMRLTESLADEMKDRGVRVNAVLPSIIDTPQNRKDMPNADFAKWVAPEALAEVIAFLLSDRARAMTGALVPVVGRV